MRDIMLGRAHSHFSRVSSLFAGIFIHIANWQAGGKAGQSKGAASGGKNFVNFEQLTQ